MVCLRGGKRGEQGKVGESVSRGELSANMSPLPNERTHQGVHPAPSGCRSISRQFPRHPRTGGHPPGSRLCPLTTEFRWLCTGLPVLPCSGGCPSCSPPAPSQHWKPLHTNNICSSPCTRFATQVLAYKEFAHPPAPSQHQVSFPAAELLIPWTQPAVQVVEYITIAHPSASYQQQKFLFTSQLLLTDRFCQALLQMDVFLVFHKSQEDIAAHKTLSHS